MAKKSIITVNGYTVTRSISGYWRLMRGDELIYDDSACEDLNGDEETATAFFIEYLNECMMRSDIHYEGYDATVIEDERFYHIDFHTGLGEAHYLKEDWTLENALKDQAAI